MRQNTVVFFIFISLLIQVASAGKLKREIHSGGCPKNAIFKECTNFCPAKSCNDYMTKSACFSLRCGPPGCMCKEGHILLNSENKENGCVRVETCRRLEKIQETKSQLAQASH